MNLSAELLAGLAALFAALATLGVPKIWDILQRQQGYVGDERKLSLADSIQQRADWRNQVAELLVRVDKLQASVDEWQAKYYEARQEHRDCVNRMAMLEARIVDLESKVE